MKSTQISAGTIARTILLALALLNQLLAACGVQALPIEDEAIHTLVSTLWTTAASLAAWWKNNSFTRAARTGDAAMQQAREVI